MGAFEYPKTNSRNGNKGELYFTLLTGTIRLYFLITAEIAKVDKNISK